MWINKKLFKFIALINICVFASVFVNKRISVVTKDENVNYTRLNLQKDTLKSNYNTTLVLCTTFSDIGNIQTVENTFRVWNSLRPHVHPVFFYTNSTGVLRTRAKYHSLSVFPCPDLSSEKEPTCSLGAMLEVIQTQFYAQYYGYANGDILFDIRLIDTLQAISKSTYMDQINGRVLIVGRRYNYLTSPDTKFTHYKEVTYMQNKTALFTEYAEDYFITPHGTPLWSKIPRLVVGRPAYDNFLVARALQLHHLVIDITGTILALHQTGIEGDFANQRRNQYSVDKSLNYRTIGKEFDYSAGRITCAQLCTRYNTSVKNFAENWRCIDIQRNRLISNCENAFRKLKIYPFVVLDNAGKN